MTRHCTISRRQALKLSMGVAGAALAAPYSVFKAFASTSAPTSPVAIRKCVAYDKSVLETLDSVFDSLGGIGSLVRGKSVCIKVNLTGDPRKDALGLPANRTYHTHPAVVEATCVLLDRAGAKRITVVESLLFNQPKEEVFTWAGWDLAALRASGKDVRLEDTRNIGSGKGYAEVKVPWGGYTYPAYELNEAYVNTDVCVSIAKLKEHMTAGITLTLKNMFGIAPNSIYSDDAGSEDAHGPRGAILHRGEEKPRGKFTKELEPDSPREGGYRVPRVTVDLAGARPIDLAIIDAIEAMQGGEGPWCKTPKTSSPGLLIAGRNAVCTDAVGTAVMGYDPQADRGVIPFEDCDNHLNLAAAVGLGSNKLSEIEVRGVELSKAIYPYDSSLRAPYSKEFQRMFIRRED
ncbi:MAG: DUF362 domain-containing protein [bacterium]